MTDDDQFLAEAVKHVNQHLSATEYYAAKRKARRDNWLALIPVVLLAAATY